MLNVWIDNLPIKAYFGYTILQLCNNLGLDIPRFCYHDRLEIAGNCRMCLVEVKNSSKLVISCSISLISKMQIFTNTYRVKLARQNILEFLLVNHPLDCPICDQGGECDLQDITMLFGADRGRFYEIKKRSVLNKDFGPLIRTSMNRCIHCTRCVRFFEFVSFKKIIGLSSRGQNLEITTFLNKFIFHELSGNIIDLCPVGALTSKPFSFKFRTWELVSLKTIDILDSLNSTIYLDLNANKIVRILPYLNSFLNEDWITNKVRYSYDALFFQRLLFCFLKINFAVFVDFFYLEFFSNFYIKISWNSAFNIFFLKLFNSKLLNFYIFLGYLIDLDSTLFLKKFSSYLSVYNNFFEIADINLSADFEFLFLFNTNLLNLSFLPSFCLMISLNTRFESPIFNLKLGRLLNNLLTECYLIGSLMNYSSFEIKVLSNNLSVYLDICEFKNIFCKKFYLINFLDYPLILVSFSFLMKIEGYIFVWSLFLFCYNLFFISNNFSKNYNFFCIKNNDYFSFINFVNFIHVYSGSINALSVGFVTGINFFTNLNLFFSSSFKLTKKNSLLYAIGCDNFFFQQIGVKLNFWIIYQGTHASGFSNFANLIFPILSHIEYSSFYINMFGNLNKTNSIFLYNLNLKSNTWIFKHIIFLSVSKLYFSYFKFSYYLGINYIYFLNNKKNNFVEFISFDYRLSFNLINFFFLKIYSSKAFYFLIFFYYKFFFFSKSIFSSIFNFFIGSFFKIFCKYLNNLKSFIFNSSFNYLLSNYYVDSSNSFLMSSKVMNSCLKIFLKKNNSFVVE